MTTIQNELVLSADDPAALRGRYDRDGVVQVNSVLSPAEIDEIRDAFMQQVASDREALGAIQEVADDDILSRYPRFMQPHRRPDLPVGKISRRLMTDPRILDIVTALVGPAYGAQSMFYFKPPSARGQAMHQDNYFLRAHPETCIAAWIAVDRCDAANGGLSVVPGSHAMEVVCPETADAEQSFTTGLVRPPEGMTAVQTDMQPGDVLFFHGSAVHGSLPNTTTDRFRRSLIFHYVPQDSREVSRFYMPLIAHDGTEVSIDEATGGGPCGDGWEGAMH
ncbi:phytanoyl-CoA dioxygenase family protein [Microlunatus elymi]|uniref:Phytanoyl-CoA dioxygenase family protein n=1 Tax=Microlunatus elymi TaxID=2596828 RepID=A0A516Q2I7_9ACTN|nr:phytanoyl-CoA dioxygenase family protein [Microlunatus elymi]QDP97421.1 phytanoyl-CoA dioxygenase family protein [Microlunatus elymi]